MSSLTAGSRFLGNILIMQLSNSTVDVIIMGFVVDKKIITPEDMAVDNGGHDHFV